MWACLFGLTKKTLLMKHTHYTSQLVKKTPNTHQEAEKKTRGTETTTTCTSRSGLSTYWVARQLSWVQITYMNTNKSKCAFLWVLGLLLDVCLTMAQSYRYMYLKQCTGASTKPRDSKGTTFMHTEQGMKLHVTEETWPTVITSQILAMHGWEKNSWYLMIIMTCSVWVVCAVSFYSSVIS